MHDRPALREVFGILVACAILLAVLAKLDNEAAREYQARAQKAIAARQAARAAAEQRAVLAAEAKAPKHRVVKIDARTESLGGRGPIAIPVGPAWTGRTKQADPAAKTALAARNHNPTSPVSALLALMIITGLAMAALGASMLAPALAVSRRQSA